MSDERQKDLPQDWREGLDGDLGQLVQKKGWRSARDVLTSYQNLEKLVGGDRLAVPGRDAGPEAWGPVWDKLGRPQEPGGYDFAPPDGVAYDAAHADWFRETAFKLGLSQDQAKALHDSFLEHFPATPVDEEKSPDEPEVDLRGLWGRQYERNMAAARRAYGAFLGDERPFDEIAENLGESALMDLLAKVGRAIGEDSITARADAKGNGPRSAGEALSEIARLQQAAKADAKHPYVNKTHPEHNATVKRMEDLFAVAYGG